MAASLGQVWRAVQTQLEEAGIGPGPREGRALVQAVLGLDDMALVTMEGAPFPQDKMAELDAMAARRATGEPLAYILGGAWFYGRWWKVGPGVLIPRPDTEVLVQEALARLEDGARLLEVGVGSGAVAGSILAERPDVRAVAVDISPVALEMARENLQAQGVAERCEVRLGDGLARLTGMFNMIVSNPPYVSDSEFENLEDGVKLFEPKLALVGDMPNPDGLRWYGLLAAGAREKLLPGGWLCVEVGWQQGSAVTHLLQQESGTWCDVTLIQDLGGRGRVVCAKRRG